MKTLYSEYAVDVQRRKAEQEDPASPGGADPGTP